MTNSLHNLEFSTPELYAIRFVNNGYWIDSDRNDDIPLPEELVDEYTSYQNKIAYTELIKLEEGKVPGARGGMDVDSVRSYNLVHQDDLDIGEVAYLVVATYTEAEYTFGSSFDEKKVVAVCKDEQLAYNLQRRLYTTFEQRHYISGISADANAKFDILEMKVS